MTTYRNKNFIKRDYECSNIVACKIIRDEYRMEDGIEWEAADDAALAGLATLWIQSGVQYYGYI